MSESTSTESAPPLSPADAAVKYLLDRAQENPDLGYLIGLGTEAFRLLCLAEAARLGVPMADVERRRRTDEQPDHSWRQPAIIVADRRIVMLESRLSVKDVAAVHDGMDAWERDERDRVLARHMIRASHAGRGRGGA